MVKPVVLAMVVADQVYQDKRSGKSVIAGTFTKILFSETEPDGGTRDSQPDSSDAEDSAREDRGRPAVFMVGSPHIYLALTGVRKDLDLKIRLVDLSDARVMMDGNIPIRLAEHDPVAIREFAIPLPRLPIPKGNGQYSVDILDNGEQLASWRIDSVLENHKLNSGA